MAFVGILASLILSLSVSNFQMKTVDRQAQTNFYTAESLVDELKAGLEEKYAELIENCYKEILVSYSNLSVDSRNSKFKEILLRQFLNDIDTSIPFSYYSMNTYSYRSDYFNQFIKDKVEGTISISSSNPSNNLDWELDYLASDKQYIKFKDILVAYTDANGYQSAIETDLKIAFADVAFDAVGNAPPFVDYSLIADVQVLANGNTGNVVGNVYAGDKGIIANAGSAKLNLKSNQIVTRHKILAQNSGEVIIDDMDADAATYFAEVWAKGIGTDQTNLSGGRFNGKGMFYLSDDISADSASSEITLSGDIFAYGYGDTPDTSSAIIANRSNCTIDLRDVRNIFVGGRAFIVPEVAYVAGGEEGPTYDSSVLTGEAISTKGNQSIYLIPGDAIGYNADLGIGFGRNPITTDEYNMIQSNGDLEEVNMNYELLTGKRLSDYADGFKRIYDNSSGVVKIYYYLQFKTVYAANDYFRDCMGVEVYRNEIQASLDKYASKVLKPSILNGDSGRKTYAGNVVFTDYDSVNSKVIFELLENSVNAVLPEQFRTESISLGIEYKALYEKLMRSTSDYVLHAYDPTSAFKAMLITSSAAEHLTGAGIVELIAAGKDAGTLPGAGMYVLINNRETTPVDTVIAAPGDNAIRISSLNLTQTALIITTGDVIVDEDVSGLIISGGRIFFENGATVTAKPKDIYKIICGTEVKSVFRDFDSFGYYLETEEHQKVEIGDLITTENWSKN